MTQRLTTAAGAPVANNQDARTAGPRCPMLLHVSAD
jgi:catalase